MREKGAGLRLDKWLWHARFFKTRSLCAKQVSGGHFRLNGQKISKPATIVRIGDGLVFPQGRTQRIVKIVALGTRRGPAPEAQALYDDLTPKPDPAEFVPDVANNDHKGRPTKKDRRQINQMWGKGP